MSVFEFERWSHRPAMRLMWVVWCLEVKTGRTRCVRLPKEVSSRQTQAEAKI